MQIIVGNLGLALYVSRKGIIANAYDYNSTSL